jgi:hypothetical protein
VTQPVSTVSLSACAAVVIATDDGGTASLCALAKAVGFGAALDFRTPSAHTTDLMPFYFLHHTVTDAAKARFLKAIRATEDPRKKYAAVILFLPKGPAHQTVFYVEMGFDDVLFLSESNQTISDRLLQQVGQEVVFVQTGSYLGPDRRRMERIRKDDPRRRPGGSGQYSRLSVLRDPVHGPRVEALP